MIQINKFSGFLYGLLSSASFGLIPLFVIPCMNQGMNFLSVLTYRFLLATLCLALLLVAKKESFRIKITDLPVLALLAVFYLASALFLFWGYKFMASGIATTIHFMYPVLTTVIMMAFFHEKKSLWRISAILLAVTGVYSLSSTEGSGSLSLTGILIVLLSALGYALYLVAVGAFKSKSIQGLKLTFYVFLIGSLFLTCGVSLLGDLQSIPSIEAGYNLLLLAIIPTIISNLSLIAAIKRIGSTITSVLGAMEPVTAVAVGILVFGEPFTVSIAIGIGLIISAVTIIILKR